MTDDKNPSSPNPCCINLLKRCQKLENSREILRKSVKIQEVAVTKQGLQIASLNEDVEKKRMQIEQQNSERIKLASINKELETQIQDMKVKISSAECTRCLNSNDEDEIGTLKAHIMAGREEIKSLKDLLEKERRKNDFERKRFESEKSKATENLKLLTNEKKKGEECICLLASEKKKVEDLQMSLEKSKIEAKEMREKLNAEIAKAHDEKKQIELKAYGEKKRADSERKKIEEQKMLIEEERKKAIDIKSHTDHLTQILDEERRKREEVQKKLEDVSAISTSWDRERNVFKTLKAAELKHLKERLKLQRKRVKHAERVAKQEKSEKNVVVQEVHFLKQNLMQILYRLNMLDAFVCPNMGSMDTVQKTWNYPDLACFKVNNLPLSKKDDYSPEPEFGSSDIQYGVPLTCAEPIGKCIGLPVSRGCCTKPKTGINSGLESPVGGSLRNKSQSSAVCSTSMHFSDRKLMGSQGNDSVVGNSTANFEAKCTVVSGFPDAVAQSAMNRSCQVSAEDIHGNASLKRVEKPCSNSSTYKSFAQVGDNSSKKRKFDCHVKSVACLHPENNLHSVIGDKVPNVNDRIRNLDQFSLTNCSKSSSIFRSTIKCANKKKAGKSKTKVNSDLCRTNKAGSDSSQSPIAQAVTSLDNKHAFLKCFENLRSGGYLKLLELENYSDEVRYINATRMPLSPTLPEIEMPNFHLNGINDSHALMAKDIPVPLLGQSDRSVSQHNTLYDIAVDTSLTDTNQSLVFESSCHSRKPETRTGQPRQCVDHFPAEHNKIEIEALHLSKSTNSNFSSGCKKSQLSPETIDGFSTQSHPHHGCSTGSSSLDNLGSTRNSCLGGAELNKAQGGCKPSSSVLIQNRKKVKTTDNPIFDERLSLILTPDADKLNKRSSLVSSEKVNQPNIQELSEFDSISKVPNPTFSSQENLLSDGDDESNPGKKLCYFTSFSSAKNMDCMIRIICALNGFAPQSLMVSDTDLLIGFLSDLLCQDLQSEEKVAVFFSFLLGSLSARMSVHCKHIVDGDSFQFLDSFSMEISRVISTGKIKHFLDQIFHVDILFHLMESFLIERHVLVISDIKQHPSSFPAFPDSNFHLDVGNNCVLSKNVTVSQFIAGCMIFATICVAADDIGFLLAFSYKMLRTCQDDITSVLQALHVFAIVCGKRFFNIGNYRFLVGTISSVTLLLEGRSKSVSDQLPHNHKLAPGLVADFSQCKQCPFATDALCMDKIIGFLLDKLEDYSLPRNDFPNTNNYFITSNSSVPTGAISEKDLSDGKSKSDVPCDASCAIFGHIKVVGNHSYSSSETVFCDFTDIISLVELVDHYMGWDWTYKEVMPRLLKMVQFCVCEDFSAALFVLVGNLGRHGGSLGGYQQAGIVELRCTLTELLEALTSRKASLLIQVAAVGALLNLLPPNFQNILNEHRDIASESCEFSCIKHVQKWFTQLCGEQQAAVKNIFDDEHAPRR
ncbi:hypothetical protein KSP39_PZI000357 [Platanthera zijinensis]|uniref:Maternal effect embryo arrest 22 n=1 Tax=Platanthera zijinensis TaxID=2320716 RepID=A0AAP0GF49_9ASPA